MRLLQYSDKALYKFLKVKKIDKKYQAHSKMGIGHSLLDGLQTGLTAGLFMLDCISLTLSYLPAYDDKDPNIMNVRGVTASVVAALTLVTIIPLSIYQFRKSYQSFQDKERKIQLTEFKLPIYQELIRRELVEAPRFKPSKSAVHEPKPIQYHKLKKKALSDAGLSAVSLFGSYMFFSFYALSFVGLGATAAVLTAPLGIGIAIGVTLVVAGLMALLRYQMLKMQKEQEHKLLSLTAKVDGCDAQLKEIKQYKMHREEKKVVQLENTKVKHGTFFAPAVAPKRFKHSVQNLPATNSRSM